MENTEATSPQESGLLDSASLEDSQGTQQASPESTEISHLAPSEDDEQLERPDWWPDRPGRDHGRLRRDRDRDAAAHQHGHHRDDVRAVPDRLRAGRLHAQRPAVLVLDAERRARRMLGVTDARSERRDHHG